MRKLYVLILLLFIITACRKDNSTFLNSSSKPGSTTGNNCLIISSEDSGIKQRITYQLDSIIASSVSSGAPSQNIYLTQETPNIFVYSEGSNQLKDVKYRVYLNSFGAVEKEVKVILNADKKTFTEVTKDANTYSYNSKQQLVRMSRKLDPDDISVFELSYDNQNRINEILVYAEDDQKVYCTYSNFKFSDQKKKDNIFQVGLASTIGAYFIPSLRNAYITHYEMSYEGLGLDPDNFDFELAFNGGVLTQMRGKYVMFGFPIEYTRNFTLDCK